MIKAIKIERYIYKHFNFSGIKTSLLLQSLRKIYNKNPLSYYNKAFFSTFRVIRLERYNTIGVKVTQDVWLTTSWMLFRFMTWSVKIKAIGNCSFFTIKIHFYIKMKIRETTISNDLDLNLNIIQGSYSWKETKK